MIDCVPVQFWVTYFLTIEKGLKDLFCSDLVMLWLNLIIDPVQTHINNTSYHFIHVSY